MKRRGRNDGVLILKRLGVVDKGYVCCDGERKEHCGQRARVVTEKRNWEERGRPGLNECVRSISVKTDTAKEKNETVTTKV